MVKAPNTPSTLEFEAPRAGGQCGRTMFCVAQKRPRGYPLPGNPSENLERETGFEPATLSLGTDFTRSPPGVSGSQALVTTGGGYDTGVQPSQPEQMLLKGFATPLLRNSGSGVGLPGGFLTVREVADLLRVSTATVYKLCSGGVLPHARVLNSIRIPATGWDRLAVSVLASRGR